jgi:hypothetical protein
MGQAIVLKTSQDESFKGYLAGDQATESAVMIFT